MTDGHDGTRGHEDGDARERGAHDRTDAEDTTAAPIASEVGADVSRAPIADVGSPVFEGADTYRPDEVFRGVTTYSGDDAYTSTPTLGVADAYEGASAYGVAGAYEPDGAYLPAVTPVAAEDIVPAGAAPSESGEPARVDPIGVYVPDDVPAAALPQSEISDAEAAATGVSAADAEALPASVVEAETGEPITPADATDAPSAVRFDD